MGIPTFANNPAIVLAYLADQEPNPDAVAYFDELVIECEGCGKMIVLSKAKTRVLPATKYTASRLLISFEGHYAHTPFARLSP